MYLRIPFDVYKNPRLIPGTLTQLYPDLKELADRSEHNEIEVLVQNEDLFIIVTKIELTERLSFTNIPFVDSKTNRRIENAFGCVLSVGSQDRGDYKILNLKISNDLKERDELLDLLSQWRLGIVVQNDEIVVVPLKDSVFELLKMTDPLLFSSLFLFLSLLWARNKIINEIDDYNAIKRKG